MIRADRRAVDKRPYAHPRIFELGMCGEFAYALRKVFGYRVVWVMGRRGGHIFALHDDERKAVDWRGVQRLDTMIRRWGAVYQPAVGGLLIPGAVEYARLDRLFVRRAYERIARDPGRYV